MVMHRYENCIRFFTKWYLFCLCVIQIKRDRNKSLHFYHHGVAFSSNVLENHLGLTKIMATPNNRNPLRVGWTLKELHQSILYRENIDIWRAPTSIFAIFPRSNLPEARAVIQILDLYRRSDLLLFLSLYRGV